VWTERFTGLRDQAFWRRARDWVVARNANEEQLLASCYKKALELAAELKARSIAFPAISTGRFGFPKREAAKIAVKEVQRYYESFDKVVFVCFDVETANIYRKLLILSQET